MDGLEVVVVVCGEETGGRAAGWQTRYKTNDAGPQQPADSRTMRQSISWAPVRNVHALFGASMDPGRDQGTVEPGQALSNKKAT